MHPKLQKKHEKIILTLSNNSIEVENAMNQMANIGAKTAAKEFKQHLKQCELFRTKVLKAKTADAYGEAQDAAPQSNDLSDTMDAMYTLGFSDFRKLRVALDKLDNLYSDVENVAGLWVTFNDEARAKAEDAEAKAQEKADKAKSKGKKGKANLKVLAETVTKRQYDDEEEGDDDES